MTDEFHSALRAEVTDSASQGLKLKLARLQHGKDSFTYSLHAFPSGYSSAGLQTTDMLAFLGFRRSRCSFGRPACFVIKVPEGFDLTKFTEAFERFSELIHTAERALSACGLNFPQPEGWAYFGAGKPERRPGHSRAQTDGHRSPKVERMKESEDQAFHYVFTWLEGGRLEGWVTHYRAKDETWAERLKLLPSLFSEEFRHQEECPEFEFEPCFWRFTRYGLQDSGWDNAEYAHGCFDAHEESFAPGVAALFEADALMRPLGFSYLPDLPRRRSIPVPPPQQTRTAVQQVAGHAARRDVFICHAGEDKAGVVRPLVETLERGGVTTWFDEAEIMWGDSLIEKVNEGLRISRFVVVVLSPAFVGRNWPERELNAALNLEATTGQVKVLPMLVGSDDERTAILDQYPLLNDKRHMVWDGTGEEALKALRRRLS